MVALNRSAVYGGSYTDGDTAAEVGWDAAITIGGGSGTWIINKIIAKYAIPGMQDYGPGGTDEARSFLGRLTVVEGEILDQISFGTPNPALYSRYPSNIGRVLFDQLINDFTLEHQFDFPISNGPGILKTQPGQKISVILLAGNTYAQPAFAPTANTVQILHVNAIKLEDVAGKIGPYRIGE